MSDIAEAVRNMSSKLDRLEIAQDQKKHSLAQELIDEGAFDVAIAYINFLKGKSVKKEGKK